MSSSFKKKSVKQVNSPLWSLLWLGLLVESSRHAQYAVTVLWLLLRLTSLVCLLHLIEPMVLKQRILLSCRLAVLGSSDISIRLCLVIRVLLKLGLLLGRPLWRDNIRIFLSGRTNHVINIRGDVLKVWVVYVPPRFRVTVEFHEHEHVSNDDC